MPSTRRPVSPLPRRLLWAALCPAGLVLAVVLLLGLLFASILGAGPVALGGCSPVSPPTSANPQPLRMLSVPAAAALPVDAQTLDVWIARRTPTSPLVGAGRTFVAAGEQFAVDPRLLVAIAAAESALGTAGPGANVHNAFGLGPGIPFASWAEGISAAARTLRERYLDRGLQTIAQIGAVWAPAGAANDPAGLNSNWVAAVSRLYGSVGGASADALSSDAASACAAAPPDATGAAAAVIGAAMQWTGVPYVWGGNHGRGAAAMLAGAPDPAAGFDCSSLVSWAYALGARLYIGDTSQEQWRLAAQTPGVERGQGLPADGLVPADLVFTRPEPDGPGHVALYAGGGRVVVASRPGTLVHELPLESQGSIFGWARWLSSDDGPSATGAGG